MIKQTLLVVSFALAGTAASAEVFSCNFFKGGTGGWVRPTIFVKVDAENNTASVMDDITRDKQEDWFPANLSANTKKRYTVSWTIRRLKSASGQNVSADYRLTVLKSSLRGKVTMLPHGYSNAFQTDGKCKRQ